MTDNDNSNDNNDIDFVIGSTADTRDDGAAEVLDTAAPRQTDRRLITGLVVAALAVVAVVVAVRSNGAGEPAAGPTNSSSLSSSYGPAIPTFPTLSSAPLSTAPVVNLGPRLCLKGRRCVHPMTPATARAKITAAIRRHLGRATQLRIRDSRLATRANHLFARSITAVTPRGRLTLVAADVDPSYSVDLPTEAGSAAGIGAETSDNGYVVNGIITLRGPVNALRNVPAIDGLLTDERLVAAR